MNAGLTVVMPTRRRPHLIGRALASVLRQDVADLMVLVLDNASGDDTEAVVAAFARRDGRVKYVGRPQDVGLEENFADGLERVQTPYVAFLPDDDFLLPGCYRTAVDALQADPTLGFVAMRMVFASPDGSYSVESGMASGRYQPPGGVLEMARNGHRTWMGTVFRTACRDAGIGLRPAAGPVLDLDFQLAVASRFPVLALEALGGVYATGPSPENQLRWDPWLARLEAELAGGYGLDPGVAAQAASAFRRRRVYVLFAVALADIAAGGTSARALADAVAAAGDPGRAGLLRALASSHAVARPAINLGLTARRALRPRRLGTPIGDMVARELAALKTAAQETAPAPPAERPRP